MVRGRPCCAGVEALAGPRSRSDGAVARALRARGRGHPVQGQRRPAQLVCGVGQPRLRAHGQPVGARPLAWRLEWGRGRAGRRRRRPGGGRHRHRRQRPHPRALVRGLRDDADPGPVQRRGQPRRPALRRVRRWITDPPGMLRPRPPPTSRLVLVRASTPGAPLRSPAAAAPGRRRARQRRARPGAARSAAPSPRPPAGWPADGVRRSSTPTGRCPRGARPLRRRLRRRRRPRPAPDPARRPRHARGAAALAAAAGARRSTRTSCTGWRAHRARSGGGSRTMLDREGLDALIGPAYALAAVLHGTALDVAAGQSYTSLYNLLGMPAPASRPSRGWGRARRRTAAGMPVGQDRRGDGGGRLGLGFTVESEVAAPAGDPTENPNVVRSLLESDFVSIELWPNTVNFDRASSGPRARRVEGATDVAEGVGCTVPACSLERASNRLQPQRSEVRDCVNDLEYHLYEEASGAG